MPIYNVLLYYYITKSEFAQEFDFNNSKNPAFFPKILLFPLANNYNTSHSLYLLFFFNPLVNGDQSPKAKLFFLKSNFFPPTTNYPISHSLYVLFFSQQSVVIMKITVGYSVVCDLYENVNTINR